MVTFRLPFATFLSAGLAVSCQQPPERRLAPYPPALPHGQLCDVVVAARDTGSPAEVAACLVAALRSLPNRSACATVRARTASGQLLAYATVAVEPAHDRTAAYQAEDARELLIGCLRSVRRWTRPSILVSSDAAGTVLLASAALTPYLDDPDYSGIVFRHPLKLGSNPPLAFLSVSGVSPQDASWLLESAVVRYVEQTSSPAPTQAAQAGK